MRRGWLIWLGLLWLTGASAGPAHGHQQILSLAETGRDSHVHINKTSLLAQGRMSAATRPAHGHQQTMALEEPRRALDVATATGFIDVAGVAKTGDDLGKADGDEKTKGNQGEDCVVLYSVCIPSTSDSGAGATCVASQTGCTCRGVDGGACATPCTFHLLANQYCTQWQVRGGSKLTVGEQDSSCSGAFLPRELRAEEGKWWIAGKGWLVNPALKCGCAGDGSELLSVPPQSSPRASHPEPSSSPRAFSEPSSSPRAFSDPSSSPRASPLPEPSSSPRAFCAHVPRAVQYLSLLMLR